MGTRNRLSRKRRYELTRDKERKRSKFFVGLYRLADECEGAAISLRDLQEKSVDVTRAFKNFRFHSQGEQ